ncbi:hypothetical protein CUC15_12470 [Oceanobacillus zhaokaii]|uniref:Prepilin-type N-terminal cleavage/methylation domain-containing protein n=1 Tax=Oceanobacillus zhaokaii TaxID=2052660 RepID=A0A345PI57_9BACI|nr:type II secretion system protein [Oceanobacillus zhaokaii]AXI09687.1 hypothetical protein CUC15_12470 [Oceanobacillus zhaokaii]
MMNNEKGITLIEVLATLVISSLFMGIIYTVVMMSMEYSSVETKKTQLQQEANYIITDLQRIHRNGECYVLSITESEVAVAEDCANKKMEVLSSGYVYKTESTYDRKKIDPNIENVDLSNFRIQDSENENIVVEITTIISRYKNTE